MCRACANIAANLHMNNYMHRALKISYNMLFRAI